MTEGDGSSQVAAKVHYVLLKRTLHAVFRIRQLMAIQMSRLQTSKRVDKFF